MLGAKEHDSLLMSFDSFMYTVYLLGNAEEGNNRSNFKSQLYILYNAMGNVMLVAMMFVFVFFHNTVKLWRREAAGLVNQNNNVCRGQKFSPLPAVKKQRIGLRTKKTNNTKDKWPREQRTKNQERVREKSFCIVRLLENKEKVVPLLF